MWLWGCGAICCVLSDRERVTWSAKMLYKKLSINRERGAASTKKRLRKQHHVEVDWNDVVFGESLILGIIERKMSSGKMCRAPEQNSCQTFNDWNSFVKHINQHQLYSLGIDGNVNKAAFFNQFATSWHRVKWIQAVRKKEWKCFPFEAEVYFQVGWIRRGSFSRGARFSLCSFRDWKYMRFESIHQGGFGVGFRVRCFHGW